MEGPFFNSYSKLSFLNDDDKTKLKRDGINNNLFPSNTLFNYHSFIKSLNTAKTFFSIENWYLYNNFNNFTLSVKLIYKTLFKIFIENGASLRTFEVITYVNHDYLNDIFEMILQNPNFIYKIKNLTLEGITNVPNIVPLYHFYHQIIDFKKITLLEQVFEYLNCLESIHIFYCPSLNSDFSQQIRYCSNFKVFKFFDRSCFYTPDYIYPTLDLIKNIGKNLNYLIIEFSVNAVFNSIVLKGLGLILPFNLEYLKLSFEININDFKIFLNDSQNKFINKLVIKNNIFLNNSQKSFFKKIKKLVKRNKTKVIEQDILPYIL
ncbi:hypothetical protein C1645_836245 [Glomus cerebriforme]|uniref:F-box domain-containing protein n=1 Tax=Glomus cerebriforme TaxID=658196 RepID=A0A397S662_9GLOM|nr:hypothetical protein C1645_836245 [Glomus cerebriforme]